MWWLLTLVYPVVSLVLARYALWEQDDKGKFIKTPGFAVFVGLLWPFLVIGSVGIWVGKLIGILFYGMWKAVAIPGYYWFTPAKVRKQTQPLKRAA